jgi:PAS domain-containing protein
LIVEARAARRAESAARVDRGRFQDFAQIASDWVWETDAAMKLTYVSDDIQSFSGLPAAAYLGRSVDRLLASSDAPEAKDASLASDARPFAISS